MKPDIKLLWTNYWPSRR